MKTYQAHHYTVTDDKITPTGEIETYTAENRDSAMLMILYVHRLHNGRAYATPHGVIRCPSCGVVAVVGPK